MHETFWTLLRDPAHWAFEIFVTLVFDGLVLGLLWPFLHKHWKHHADRDMAECVDEESEFARLMRNTKPYRDGYLWGKRGFSGTPFETPDIFKQIIERRPLPPRTGQTRQFFAPICGICPDCSGLVEPTIRPDIQRCRSCGWIVDNKELANRGDEKSAKSMDKPVTSN